MTIRAAPILQTCVLVRFDILDDKKCHTHSGRRSQHTAFLPQTPKRTERLNSASHAEVASEAAGGACSALRLVKGDDVLPFWLASEV